jgi:hypothetical protein
VNFAATWEILGEAAFVTYPKVELSMFPLTALGPKNCV